jgi:hypothetical protein
MSKCTQFLHKSDGVQAQSPAACVARAHTQREKVTLVFKSLERVLKEQLCMTQVLQGVRNARFVLLGPIQLHQVTRFGLQFHSIYQCALILLFDFVVDAIV